MTTGRFQGLVLGTNLTGTDNADGTITVDAAGGGSGIPDTIFDAKGDLVAATAADTPARLAVGTNAQVLTADSAEATGMKWATPSAGAAGAMTLLSSTTLGSAGTFDITSISGSYNDLILHMIIRSVASAPNGNARLYFNNDTGANYYVQKLRTRLTTNTATELIGHAQCFDFLIPGNTAPSGLFSQIIVTVGGYTSTAIKKGYIAQNVGWMDITSNNLMLEQIGGLWNNTAAINRVTVDANGSNCVTGSQLRIYGRL